MLTFRLSLQTMRPIIDITGKTFGNWVVVGQDHSKPKGPSSWITKCKCGKTKSIRGTSLRRGDTISCGCVGHKLRREANTKHGHCPRIKASSTYISWRGMLSRCDLTGTPFYKYYGGVGVTVCPRWRKFEAFLKDMGERPPGTSIDRIDPFGNYEPGNCRWVDGLTQRRNTRKRKISTQKHGPPLFL